MAYSKYVTQFKDKNDNVYGVMDEECRLSLKNGTHEDLTAGNALFLLSDRGETDNEPYAFRKTGGSKNAYGREMLKKVVGGTVCWNQRVQNGNFESADGWNSSGGTKAAENNILSVTLTSTGTAIQISKTYTSFPTVDGHKYFAQVDMYSPKQTVARIQYAQIAEGTRSATVNANTWTPVTSIFNSIGHNGILCYYNTNGTLAVDDVVQFKNFVCFDLTQMFGSTIADAIYTMEQTTAGSRTSW